METVQLTIHDARYAASLQDLLVRGGARHVERVDVPDPRHDGVIVVDSEGLERLPSPLLNPERVVLITRNDPIDLSRAWNAGIRSVVFSEDPLSTAVLAIQAAELRVPKPEPRWAVPHAHPGSAAHCSGCVHPVRKPSAPLTPDAEMKVQQKEGLK